MNCVEFSSDVINVTPDMSVRVTDFEDMSKFKAWRVQIGSHF